MTLVHLDGIGKQISMCTANAGMFFFEKDGLDRKVSNAFWALVEHSKLSSRYSGSSAEVTATIRGDVAILYKARQKQAICISPRAFADRCDSKLSSTVARAVLSEFPFARQLKSYLTEHGLYYFTQRMNSQVNLKRAHSLLDRLIASITLAFHGLDDPRELDTSAFKMWIKCFRTPDLSRWETAHWTSIEVTNQCLREFVLAISRFLEDFSLAQLAGNVRLQIGGQNASQTGLMSWTVFEQSEDPVVMQWRDLFDDWRDEDPSSGKAANRKMIRLVTQWSLSIYPGKPPLDVMCMDRPPETFSQYIFRSYETKPHLAWEIVPIAHEFYEFIEEILHSIGKTPNPLVDKTVLKRAKRERKTYQARAEVSSIPLPPKLLAIADELLAEGEHGWPGTIKDFREVIRDEYGNHVEVYCPVLPTLLRALLFIPSRGVQMVRLDSGEGDLRAYNGELMEWTENHSIHAGYWARSGDTSASRGYAREVGEAGEKVTGIFLNTNKTGDPHVIPWEEPRLHRMLWELRLWQERHNPIDVPIEPSVYMKKDKNRSHEFVIKLPAIFPLFRLPSNSRSKEGSVLPSSRRRDQAFKFLQIGIQERWNQKYPEAPLAEDLVTTSKTGTQSSIYGLHGLRAAGITRLLEAGVAPELVAKFISGHRSLAMVLAYAKFDARQVHRVLDTAAINAQREEDARFIEELGTYTFEEAKRRVAVTRDDGLQAAIKIGRAGNEVFINTDVGICPWGGTRCYDGGPLRGEPGLPTRGKAKPVYEPVEGGEENCVLCRHLVSGPPWMARLTYMGTKYLNRMTYLTDEWTTIEQQKLAILAERNVSSDEKVRRTLQKREAELSHRQSILHGEQAIALKAAAKCQELINLAYQATILDAEQGRSGVSLVAVDEESIVEYMETTEFERNYMISAAARVYPICKDQVAEVRLGEAISDILWANGGASLRMSGLSREAIADSFMAMAQLFMERLDRDQLQALTDGRTTLEDVGLVQDVEQIVGMRLGRPIEQVEAEQSPRRPSLLEARS